MERKIYPYSDVPVDIKKLDKATVAAAIITQRQLGLSKAQAIGHILNGSDDVITFNETWSEVEAERKALAALDPLKFSTAASFISAMKSITKYISSDTWVEHLKTKYNVSTWPQLKSVLKA